MRARTMAAMALLGGMACGGGRGGEGTADAAAGDDGGAAGDIGFVAVMEVSAVRFGGDRYPDTRAEAWFALTGPPPWHQVTMRNDDCVMREYTPGFCEEPCTGLCVDPGTCLPWPDYVSAGTLTFDGLDAALALEPSGLGTYQTAGGLPSDLFAGGDDVTVTASGGDVPPFTLTARAVEQLAVEPAPGDVVTLAAGQDFTFDWQPEPGARMRVVLAIGGQFHGVPSPAIIECDVADEGTVTIPASFVDALPQPFPGCSKGRDCSKLILTRYRQDRGVTSVGAVSFEVQSVVEYILARGP